MSNLPKDASKSISTAVRFFLQDQTLFVAVGVDRRFMCSRHRLSDKFNRFCDAVIVTDENGFIWKSTKINEMSSSLGSFSIVSDKKESCCLDNMIPQLLRFCLKDGFCFHLFIEETKKR